ncbi:prepilin-type N-terminal cleavage/methylation domain-containing protein [Candidatus Saccharibacteria bacterium]|jgi:prepilin-type N-terminal cleavage/methylation domain-containing protein|nr:prepilin-type N-terminal cleavage/methylation domain-containing protein [Candidatus Saccharibacteria bacterium]MBP9131553.1 prepilin-type N-terminal cleavage/methylation domain-containing protein [Candidatus Saccharibacteria bacterium]
MKSLRNRSEGFTIIELLIVIVVIGILAGLVLNSFGNIQERARDTERQNDINSIHTALELFYTDNSGYPNVAAAADLDGFPKMELNPEATVAPNASETYTYTPTCPGASVVGTGADCTTYVLNATLEADGSTFSRNALN